MKRSVEADLEAWATRKGRKPLIVRGARQVGKSWVIREFGRRHFGRVVEVNLERRADLHAAFSDNDPRDILARIELGTGQSLPADGTTLLFLDEIQARPDVIGKLRWFAEELPGLPIIAAGSLLDFVLADPQFSMPVGRISFLHVEPMGFFEFCAALDQGPLLSWMNGLEARSLRKPNPLVAVGHDRALALARIWLLTGGMPAVVDAYRLRRSFLEVTELQRDLMSTFRDDFHKYAGRIPHARLMAVLDSIPQQLGQKWSFVQASRDERAAALRQALDLLAQARLCHRVHVSPAHGLPLAAGRDDRTFKCLHLDVGLVSSMLGMNLATIARLDEGSLINRGALAEQAVGQLLRCTFDGSVDPELFYWQRDKAGSEAELDFVLAIGPRLVPIEVKAGATGSLRSLHRFMAERKLGLAARLHGGLPGLTRVDLPEGGHYQLLSLPFYMTEALPRMLADL